MIYKAKIGTTEYWAMNDRIRYEQLIAVLYCLSPLYGHQVLVAQQAK